MRMWQVMVQTPEGERGYIDIPRPAADLTLPVGLFSEDTVCFYYDQTHNLRSLVRQLVARADLTVRRPGDPAPSVVPAPPLSRSVLAPRRRARVGIAGPRSTTIRLFHSKEAGYVTMGDAENQDVLGRSVCRRVGESSTAAAGSSRGVGAVEPPPQKPVPEDTSESSKDDEE